MKDCTTCKYGYEDERLGIQMCHHPKRFSEDCIDFNMHEEKEIKEVKAGGSSEIPNDLEEAAKDYAEGIIQIEDALMCKQAFIAGAKWKQDHTPLPEDTVLFNKGVEEGKRLMMEEAVEGVVCYGSKGAYIETDFLGEYDTDVYGNPGDKVRVIVLQKED